MERDLCNKCGACCENIAVDFERKIMYRDGIQALTKEFESILSPHSQKENIKLCSCKWLKEKLCTNPNKPGECKNYPSSPFAFLPEECGFEGEIFLKNENIKQKVRKLKEEIVHYSALLSTDKQYQRIIERHQAYIDSLKSYGSEDW